MRLTSPIPDRILRLMAKKDRPPGQLTWEEAQAKATVKAERDLQRQIAQYLRLQTLPFYCARMDKRTTNRIGQPDFLICLDGRFVAWVVKVGRNQPSGEQEGELALIRQNGGLAYVVRSFEQARALIQNRTPQPRKEPKDGYTRKT